MEEADRFAHYAMHVTATAGRVHPEPPHPYRNPYQRDRDRIIHASAFRRLAHKTQVFIGQMGDYHRSRLTHTLEVASIARTVGRTLRLNEDLIEALALAHDIGHPPFGHAGEEVLDECLQDHGGFNHNAQALRIMEVLESRYPDFPGLNLSREILDGQKIRASKHHPPDAQPQSRLLEVQVVDAADNIAYDAHDPDDAIELGLLELGDLESSTLWMQAVAGARSRYAGLDDDELRRAAVHQLIDILVSDLLAATSRRLEEFAPVSPADVLRQLTPLAAPSEEIAQQQAQLEQLLAARIYRHPLVLAQRASAGHALRSMYHRLLAEPQLLPPQYAEIADHDGLPRAAADFLACMTDRYALDEFARLAQQPT